jgi:hypothetical protein
MAVYSVFEPPVRGSDGIDHAERFRFVRDSFTWSAFLFGPLWMLRHRLWLVLLLYVLLIAAVVIGFRMLRMPIGGEVIVIVLLAWLIGFEAPTLRRWTLQRRGWEEAGVIVADDLDMAEQRFFDEWATREFSYVPRSSSRPLPSAPPSATAGDGSDVIGLFPTPGTSR